MEYLKVRWLHRFEDEPILMLSELDERRFEVRKVEVFADGRTGFASEETAAGGAMLGEVPVPSSDKISSDPQFVVEELLPEEFEAAWTAATADGRSVPIK
jgi:hypothetical protein